MKRIVLVSAGLLASALVAEPVCESELARGESSAAALDLRPMWPITAVGQLPIQNISYSSVGWDLVAGAPGNEVRLFALPCTETEDGSLEVETPLRTDIAVLTGCGTTTWAAAPDHRIYRLVHQVATTSSGLVGAEKELAATFDFRALATPATAAEVRAALLADYSLGLALENDATAPWTIAAGGGIAASSSSEIKLTFAGCGTFSFDYFLRGGTLAVTVDGEAATVDPSTGDWRKFSTDVADRFAAHTVTIAYGGTDGVTVRDCAFRQLTPAVVVSGESPEVALDLSSVWTVESLQSDLLKGISYSSVGWDILPDEKGSTVSLSAAPTSGGERSVIASSLSGRGTLDWAVSAVQKTVYEMTHEVTTSASKIDVNGFLYAYYDFSNCKMSATHLEIVQAVLGFGHSVTVTDDEDDPWQPIAGAGEGVAATASTVGGETTSLTFDFVGKGTFSWQYALDAGALNVTTDGVPVRAYASATEGWTADGLAFDYGAHTVVFTFAGATGDARLKSVVWREAADEGRAETTSAAFVADLRDGVRCLRNRPELLPFAFSHTNWVGDVTADSNAVVRVDVVRIIGEGDDCSLWSEVDGTKKTLIEGSDEGTVQWRARSHSGIWKATMSIELKKKVQQMLEAYFDLTGFGPGLSIIVR